MSFTLKYDRNGKPIPSSSDYKEPTQEVTTAESLANMVENQTQNEQVMVENQTSDNMSTVVADLSTTEHSVESHQEVPTKAQENESGQAKNFRALREKAEKAERERDELIRILKQSQQQPKQQEPEEDTEINLGADDLAEGKHLAKLQKKYKKLEQQLSQYQQESSTKIIENKIQQQYPDFDKVVSRDNLEMLTASFPEIAHTLNASPDLYSKAVTAYTLIKKLGINNEDMLEMERNKIANNIAKPKPVYSVKPSTGTTPLEKANPFAQGLTKDLKSQLRAEMEEARKNRN